MQNCVVVLLLLVLPPSGETPCDAEDRPGLSPPWVPDTAVAVMEGSYAFVPGEAAGLDGAGEPDATVDAGETSPGPNVRGDLTRIYGATLLFSAVHPDVRGPFFREGSLARVGGHVRRPIRSAVEGWREDDDPVFTNYVAHPLSWGAIGYYLRSRGHSRTASLLLSQGHSLFWEYVLEGTYQKPSGKDLVTNLASAWLGIVLAGWAQAGEAPVHVELRPGAEAPGPLSLPENGAPLPSAPGYSLTLRLPI